MKYHALSRFTIDPGGGARQTKGTHTHMRKGFWRKQKVVSAVCVPESLAYDNTAHKVRARVSVCAGEKVGERAGKSGITLRKHRMKVVRAGVARVFQTFYRPAVTSPRLPFSE
jgi:hypothetical protein